MTAGDGGGGEHCAICHATAAGPCARCKKPTCGDCCVLTEGGAGQWAICLNCNKRGGANINPAWLSFGMWLMLPLLAILGAILLLAMVFGK